MPPYSNNDRETFAYEILYLQKALDYNKHWSRVGLWQDNTIRFHSSKLSRMKKQTPAGIPIMRAAVVEYPPLTMQIAFDANIGCHQGLQCVKYIDNADNFTTHCCYGLAIDVLKYVSKELEFEPFVYFVRDGNYGSKNSTSGEWNGIVNDLLKDKADISIDLMSNEARSEEIDFTMRWTHAGLALLVLVGEKNVNAIDFSFFQPFTTGLWASMIGIVNLYLFVLWFSDRSSPYGHKQSKEATDHNSFDLVGSMWYCWGMCFDNQFVDVRPKSFGARASASFLAMFSLLCLTSYTANLTAHLVSDDTEPEVTGIRDPKVIICRALLLPLALGNNFIYFYLDGCTDLGSDWLVYWDNGTSWTLATVMRARWCGLCKMSKARFCGFKFCCCFFFV